MDSVLTKQRITTFLSLQTAKELRAVQKPLPATICTTWMSPAKVARQRRRRHHDQRKKSKIFGWRCKSQLEINLKTGVSTWPDM